MADRTGILQVPVLSWATIGSIAIVLSPLTSHAQISPDNTLGVEQSTVNPATVQGLPADLIQGGAIRGSNLFHSFSLFNIDNGQRVYFANPTAIQNIFARVTGTTFSNIQGILGVDGAANLFLINPNGILFGRNAQLDLRGSFVGTTANGIQFGDRGFFSTNLPAPPSPLLTINPSALLFNQIPNPIIIGSTAPAGTSPAGRALFGLRVPDGQSLLLVGGPVIVDGGGINGGLNAQEGRIELGGLAVPGVVELESIGTDLRLAFPNDANRSDVSLLNNARINVRGNGDGEIVVNANQFSGTDGGRLVAGTEGSGNAGNITVNANTINLAGTASDGGQSGLFNQALDNTTGNGGEIVVNTNQLNLSADARISTSSFGSGGTGNVIINAQDQIAIDNAFIFNSSFGTTSQPRSDVRITTGSLALTNGAQIDASVYGRGDAGNVIIDARNLVSLNGIGPTGFRSGIFSRVEPEAVGQGGDIRITADSLSLTNGARLSSSTLGTGDSGNVIISARSNVALDGTSTTIFSSAEPQVAGQAGDIRITTDSLSLTSGAHLDSSTSGTGNAGNVIINANENVVLDGVGTTVFSSVESDAIGQGGDIRITTGSLSLTNGAQLIPGVYARGQGKSGSVIINARDTVAVDGGAIYSDLEHDAIGRGGDIRITTGSLLLSNGATFNSITAGQGDSGNIDITARDRVSLLSGSRVGTNTAGQGNAGTITLQAGDLLIDGANPTNSLPSALLSVVEGSGNGRGGAINVTANSVAVSNGGVIGGSTFGNGRGADISVQASEHIFLSGIKSDETFRSQIITTAYDGATDQGGNISISTPHLTIADGAGIIAGTWGQEQSGNIQITANAVNLTGISANGQFRSAIATDNTITSTGNAGAITLNTQRLNISGGAVITSSTFGQGQAGDVQISANTIDLVGSSGDGQFRSAIASETVNPLGGDAGNLLINTAQLNIRGGAVITSSTFGRGQAGAIQISADTINLAGLSIDGQFRSAIGSETNNPVGGDAGNLLINTSQLNVRGGAIISTKTSGTGNAGDITINAEDSITLSGVSSNIQTAVDRDFQSGIVGSGRGGNIQINARTLSLNDFAQINSSTFGTGNAGNIAIQVTDNISVNNSGQITATVSPGGNGRAGDIDIRSHYLTATGGGQIISALFREQSGFPGGQGSGGNIQITADSIDLSGSGSFGFASGVLTLSERGALGPAGNITLNTGDLRVADGALVIASTFNDGNGGNITVNARNVEILNGGQIVTNTRSSGRAGNITLNVTDSILLAGNELDYDDRVNRINQYLQLSGVTDQLSDVIVSEERAVSGLFANTSPSSSGKGGSIFIDPRVVTIRDGAGIFVDSKGTGEGGNIQIWADRLTLDNQGVISAETASSQGGNIILQLQDLLLLRRQSLISTTAGNDRAGGDGGNITINAPFIVGVLAENSDIRANAFTGQGGSINITAQGIFGLRFQPQDTPFSDITASSTFGLSGTVTLNTLGIDPSRGLVVLPAGLVDPTSRISQQCSRNNPRLASSFYIVGNGGLPERPGDPLLPAFSTGDVQIIGSQESSRSENQSFSHSSDPITDAQAWIDTDGTVHLAADRSNNQPLSVLVPCP